MAKVICEMVKLGKCKNKNCFHYSEHEEKDDCSVGATSGVKCVPR